MLVEGLVRRGRLFKRKRAGHVNGERSPLDEAIERLKELRGGPAVVGLHLYTGWGFRLRINPVGIGNAPAVAEDG